MTATADPMRDALKAYADMLHDAAEVAAQKLRDYDRRTDPPLFAAPYLTGAAEAEARGRDQHDRDRAS